MNAFKTLLPVAVAAAALAASASANAATTITIGASNGGAPTTLTSTTNPGSTNAGVLGAAVGNFDVNNITASFGPLPDLLSSTALDTSNNGLGGTLDVYVTIQGLTSAMAHTFKSSLTENVLSAGWTVTESTFLNNDNALFGTETLLTSHPFTDIGTFIGTSTPGTSDLFSVTELYHITAVGKGNAQSTIDVSGVPEPATWGLMILGFGGVGAMVRGRRRQGVFA
jgi:hypothetical protein